MQKAGTHPTGARFSAVFTEISYFRETQAVSFGLSIRW